jgi:hypothetical protein
MQGEAVVDEHGRPYIVRPSALLDIFLLNARPQIIRDQGKKTRAHGLEAIKWHILAARSVATILKTSLGPRGLDKVRFPPLLLGQSDLRACARRFWSVRTATSQ